MKKVFLLAGIIAMLSALTINAQVTVGKLTPPHPSSVMQVLSPDSTKGVLIPEMTMEQRNNIDEPADGLVIYNLSEECFNYWNMAENAWKSLCGGQGKARFLMVCDSGVVVNGTYGEKVALNSSNYIKIYVDVKEAGSYSIQAVADPDNGYFYETSGTFYSTGGFYITIPGTGQPKKHTQGTNLTDTADDTPDNFTLTSSSGADSCKFQVNVINTAVQPKFDIVCGSIQVQGAYFEDSVLTSTPNTQYDGYPNQISVQLTNIPSASFGAVATLETNEVDGISFSWTGILTSSPQIVVMQGKGTPRGLNDKILTITSNSVSNSGSCSATVSMFIPKKRMLTFGVDSDYGYNPGSYDSGRNPKNTFNTMLTDKNNFGYNQWSILRFAGFNNVQGTTLAVNAIGTLDAFNDDDRDIISINSQGNYDGTSVAALHNYLFGLNGHRKIDIVLVGYSYAVAGNATRNALAAELVKFVHSGGIMMMASENSTSNAAFFNILFYNPTPAITSVSGHGAGTNYTLGFNANNTDPSMRPYYCSDSDPILTGPFGNILGRNQGEDASTTMYLMNLPLDSIVIYSGARSVTDPMNYAAIPSTGVTIFRHVEYPFIFMGDGGFWSTEQRSYQSTNSSACPFTLTSVTKNGHTYPNYPYYRMNFGGTGNRIDNTTFIANAFAWCIIQAENYRRAHK